MGDLGIVGILESGTGYRKTGFEEVLIEIHGDFTMNIVTMEGVGGIGFGEDLEG